MKRFLVLVSATAMLGLAAPAYADEAETATNDARFLAALHDAGLSHRGSDQAAVSAGRAVCVLMDDGLTAADAVVAVERTNPGFTAERAARFAAISAMTYCPQHL